MTTSNSTSRLIVVDDNTCVTGGHYNELASLMLHAAVELGYRPVIATHVDYEASHSLPNGTEILKVFRTRRMARWSCGVDGRSRVPRGLDARPLAKDPASQLTGWKNHLLSRPHRRPSNMLRRWSAGFAEVIERLNPTSDDQIIVQTADDFQMLALADALQLRNGSPLNVKAIFHYAVTEDDGALDPSFASNQSRPFDVQLNHALSHLKAHGVELFATTPTLTAQMNGGALEQLVRLVPYPIRRPVTRESSGNAKVTGHSQHANEASPFTVDEANPRRLKLVIGGIQRAEQGREAFGDFLRRNYDQHLASGHYSLTLQLPDHRWRRMIPAEFQDAVSNAIHSTRHDSGEFVVRPADLKPASFQAMLATADLALLMYDPDRYRTRCSAVLLELLTRGVPVVVPDGCWLADIVRLYGDQGRIGYVYQDRDELSTILDTFKQEHVSVRDATQRAAIRVARDHCPIATVSCLTGRESLAQRDASSQVDRFAA